MLPRKTLTPSLRSDPLLNKERVETCFRARFLWGFSFGNLTMINLNQELIDYIKLKLMVSGGEMDKDDFVSRLTIPHEVVAHLKERIRLRIERPDYVETLRGFISADPAVLMEK